MKKFHFRVNERIHTPQVRLIDEDGKNLGIMSTSQALGLAREKGLDLVEVNPSATPPICKIMDFGRYKYELEKREKLAKKPESKPKELRLGLRITKHDLQNKIARAREFLKKGKKVFIFVNLTAREVACKDMGIELVNQFPTQLSDISRVEQNVKLEGRRITLLLAPIPAGTRHDKGKDVQDSKGQVQDNSKGQTPAL